MALQFATGTLPANLVTGLNLLHAAAWSSGPSHYDLAEVNTSAEEQVPTFFFPSTITDVATACNCTNRIKSLLNDHYGRGNAGSGSKVYGHKTADLANVISTADMADGATYDAALLASVKTLIDELRVDYAAHISNGGGVWHTAADTAHILGGSPTITSWADAAEGLNNIKAQYELHRAEGASIHAAADSTNTIAAANASSSSPDSCVTLANALRTALNAHRTQSGVHALDDSVNVVSGSAVSYPAGLFTLANACKASINNHRTSTTYHDAADTTNAISSADATTVASLLTLVEEMRVDVTAHFRAGPTTQAVRSL